METAAYFRYAQFAEIAVYFLDYVGDPGGIHGGQAFRHTYFVEGQGFSSVTVVMFVVMIVVMVVIMFVVVVMLVSMFMFMVPSGVGRCVCECVCRLRVTVRHGTGSARPQRLA